MSQWTSITPKSTPGPQSDSTRATGMRNFLKGEVITVNSDSDDDERMGNTAVPVMKHFDPSTDQGTVRQVPEGVHPSRMQYHVNRGRGSDPTWQESKMKRVLAGWVPAGSNNIPLPLSASRPPSSALTSYGTGSNHNMPPKAPKAMISQCGSPQTPRKSRFNIVQGVKQPPTGPKAGVTSRKSGAKRNRSISHLTGTPRRKKYIPVRKLKNGSGAGPTMSNDGPSSPPSTTRPALSGVDTHKYTPAAEHTVSLKIESLGHREKYPLPTNPSTSQPPSSQLKTNPRDRFNNLASTSYDPKRSTVRSQYPLFRDSVSPDPDTAPWDKYVRVPRALSKVTRAASIPLEHGHQVHHTRLNHFDHRHSTPSPEPVGYLSPPTKAEGNSLACGGGGAGPYKDGDIVGARAEQIATTSKGRRMLEKMGYKPGTSLGKSGKEETELAVATMKIGRGGLGAGPKGRGLLAAPPNTPSLSHRSNPENALPVEEKNEVGPMAESSSYPRVLGTKGIGKELLKTFVQDNGCKINGSSGGDGGTKERVVITIDSDDDDGGGVEEEEEEEKEEKEDKVICVQEVLLQEKQEKQEKPQQGQQKDQKMQENQELEVINESEAEYDPEDMEMGDAHDYVVHPQAGQASVQPLFQNSGPGGVTEEQPVENAVNTSFGSDPTVSRWKPPPFQYSTSSCRPTVPIKLLGLVIIERLEQVALADIFHCINSFEEDSCRLTDPAFNHVLAKSFLKVRDMSMRDPLLDVDQEICEGIVKEEFGILLEHLAAGGS